MNEKIINLEYFQRSALELAPEILGKILVRKYNDTYITKRITELEIYYGEDDTACHASKGKTDRTKMLYTKGGHIYVYLCYGIHNMFNIITGKENEPQGLLIRGIEDINGPGRVTKFLNIDKNLNGLLLTKENGLYLIDDGFKCEYITKPRIGIDYATEEYRDILWRYIIK